MISTQGELRDYEQARSGVQAATTRYTPGMTQTNPLRSGVRIVDDGTDASRAAMADNTSYDPNPNPSPEFDPSATAPQTMAPDGTMRNVSYDRSVHGPSGSEQMQGLYDRGMASAAKYNGDDLTQARAGLGAATGSLAMLTPQRPAFQPILQSLTRFNPPRAPGMFDAWRDQDQEA